MRLRDPWESEPLAEGGMRTRRAFHLPTSLSPREHVWLVIEGAVGLVSVAVNGKSQSLTDENVGSEGAVPHGTVAACDITPELQPRNFAELLLAAGGSRGEVRLEIRLHDLV